MKGSCLNYAFIVGSIGMRNCNSNETLFTTISDGDILLKPNRPALVVSSTSW